MVKKQEVKGSSLTGTRLIFRFNFVTGIIITVFTICAILVEYFWDETLWALVIFVFGLLVSLSPHIAREWEKGVVLRFGKFKRLIGPGMFWIIPLIDSLVSWIDQRIMTTTFTAEKTLTKDTVPVDVDAVLFWFVWDVKKAALEVGNYKDAISWSAQTALRDIIGKTDLADLLVGREKIDKALQKIIDQRSEPWGITVSRWRFAILLSLSYCRMPCRGRRRRNANGRRVLYSATQKRRSPINLLPLRNITRATPLRCTCGR